MNIQDWFPLGLTGLISLQSKELSRVFSSTTVQKYQFSTHPSLWSNFHICTWPLKNHSFDFSDLQHPIYTTNQSGRREFPDGPVVYISLLMKRAWVLSLVGELRSHMPCGGKTKTKNRSNIVTNSTKTLKMVHIEKKLFKVGAETSCL